MRPERGGLGKEVEGEEERRQTEKDRKREERERREQASQEVMEKWGWRRESQGDHTYRVCI